MATTQMALEQPNRLPGTTHMLHEDSCRGNQALHRNNVLLQWLDNTAIVTENLRKDSRIRIATLVIIFIIKDCPTPHFQSYCCCLGCFNRPWFIVIIICCCRLLLHTGLLAAA
jgi:hypothetical protein